MRSRPGPSRCSTPSGPFMGRTLVSVQAAVAEQLDSGAEGPRGPEGVGHPRLPVPAQSVDVRADGPRSSPMRRPIPTADSGSRGSAAGGSPRSSSTGRRSRPRISTSGPGRAPRSTSRPRGIPVRTRPGRSTARRSSTSPGPPGRSRVSSATARPDARWPTSWSTARRIAARQASTVRTITDAHGRYRLVGLPLGREGDLVAAPACDFSAGRNWFGIDPRLPADRCPPYFQAEVSVRKFTRQGAGPPGHRPEPGSPRHRPDHRQGHRQARARASRLLRLRR